MTSKERHQQRYLRRRARREAARAAKLAQARDFDQVFTYEHLYAAYRRCRRNVGWKASVQRYSAQAPLNVVRTQQKLLAGTYRCPDFFEFDIFERGKKRHIKSTVIGERVVQRCLCDYALVPVIGSSFVYDNGACMKNKGYDFAVRRMLCHLEKHVREHGTEGYVLIGDLKSFFDSIPHWAVEQLIRKQFTDERIVRLILDMVKQFAPKAQAGEGVGLGLGSQVSQVLAPAIPGAMDHFVKEVLGVKYYGRYMDDFYLIHHDKEFLKTCMDAIRAKCAEVGLTLSDRKTQIVKLTRGFTFLKVRTHVTQTGHIVRRIYPRSVTRQRRKLKKLRHLLINGEMLPGDVYNSFQSWDSHAARFDTWRTRQSMRNLFAQLFPEIVEEQEHLRRERDWRCEQAAREEMEQYRRMWDTEASANEGGNSA